VFFKYRLTPSQYARFQHQTNDAEITALCDSVGVKVTGEQNVDGVETWYFRGRCTGTMALVNEYGLWYCVIQVTKKPWWLPWSLLDRGFKEALK
jgi:hypothetical protein